MTLLTSTFTTTPAPLRTTEADPGFWVANHDGAFAGTIDRHADHFYVRDCFGRYLGDYPTFDTALAHLRRNVAAQADA